MSADRLDERQIAELLGKLEARHAALKLEVAAGLADVLDPGYAAGGGVQDSGDEASADVAEDVRLADIRRDREEMRDIEGSLGRMRLGSYGECTDCGEPIGFVRLKAYPTAKRCRACQERHERGLARAAGASL
ncbi:MAG TPA: TraR/DksA family transcriptional regulator [Gammaproteobacteria bacterium]|nr:TraR/DksA family transcriptional regulator [Gammaproteobacteria bacterium]